MFTATVYTNHIQCRTVGELKAFLAGYSDETPLRCGFGESVIVSKGTDQGNPNLIHVNFEDYDDFDE